MKILAVETSTDACSAALSIDGEIRELFEIKPKQHTQLLLPMIDRLMAEAQLRPQQLHAMAFSRGPGSFTGVRIAGSVAQGIAFGADLPVVPVSTLAALAQDFFNQPLQADVAFTAMDARMDEIFWGVYQRNPQNLAELIGIESVTPAQQVIYSGGVGYGVGSGWGAHRQALLDRLAVSVLGEFPDVYPRAAAIAQLGAADFANGRALSVELAMPVYLRDKVASTEAERNRDRLRR